MPHIFEYRNSNVDFVILPFSIEGSQFHMGYVCQIVKSLALVGEPLCTAPQKYDILNAQPLPGDRRVGQTGQVLFSNDRGSAPMGLLLSPQAADRESD